jgi:menaquinone-specific isochorismate synthase
MLNTSTHQERLNQLFYNQVSENSLNLAIKDAVNEKKSFFAVSISIHQIDVLAALEQVSKENQFQYYWEKTSDEFSICAAGELIRIKNEGSLRFQDCSSQGKRILNSVHHLKAINHSNAAVHLFGGFSFFDTNSSKNWEHFGASSFTLPKWMIIKEGKCTILTLCIDITNIDQHSIVKDRLLKRVNELEPICNSDRYKVSYNHYSSNIEIKEHSEFHHIHWMETVNRAKQRIQNGHFEKVVLARELTIDLPHPVKDTHILNILRRQYPECYCFLIRHDNTSSFIGCTPERLASFNSNFILTEGLAGSTSRGKTASEDIKLEHSLLDSSKDLHEHKIVLSAIEEQLKPYSLSLNHPVRPSVKKLSNVQHLYTPITATIADDVSKTQILKDLHPTPAVGGHPRMEAVDFIRKHEDFDRGWYAAPIGRINSNGDGEFAVAIRSGLIMENQVRFFAGCGIVQDSDPQREWEETNMKFIPMLSALEYAGS